ncbi:Cd(II)/Pb(II)-responsive transcriptional regulator [Stagnimonas aquatica]|uniref:Cd(II)/Pb(II)-responsive transcriptional regulator n=1 Tax=Stagnimonas aquatica TaxID=2689987 RepID=A0A3N0VA75_9GAMM|nr:Cd(II)/Pb(II)-responsive transcriptional regulator [Stagnimonas aquatica]ROH89693.1 Cd(II)/Pb(II)-responsive transcriptional regulator [Stagnimonas aquatica]
MLKTYRIGDLATLLAVPVETIRYYERETLLPKPARSDGNYRLYTSVERERLEFILNCRALDMTLQEIRNLLRLRDAPELGCGGVNDVLDEHIEHVAERIKVLRGLQSQLKALRLRCETPQASKDCGILQGLSEGSKGRPKPGRSTDTHGQLKAGV